MKSLNLVLTLLILLKVVHLEKTTTKAKDIVLPAISMSSCGCATSFPPCCSPEFSTFSCDCAPRPNCGSCPGSENMFVNLHDNYLKMAMKDAYNQQDLAQKAKLQVDLFQKAQEFAKEVGVQEMKAKQYANLLNETTRKAQYARAMMFQSAAQVRLLADQTLRAIQPMKCQGPRCGTLTSIQPFPNSVLNGENVITGVVNTPSFMFKQTNLRGE